MYDFNSLFVVCLRFLVKEEDSDSKGIAVRVDYANIEYWYTKLIRLIGTIK